MKGIALLVALIATCAMAPPAQGVALPPCISLPIPSCAGDCDRNGQVSINELIGGARLMLNAGLGCPDCFDFNGDGRVSINELIQAVNNALNGCKEPPTPTPTITPPPATPRSR